MGTAYGSAKARVMRLTRLDTCGLPVYGECSSLVTAGFVQVQAAAEFEDGEEFVVKNAWGDFCINEKDPDRLKWYTLTIDFCQVDPDAADIAAGLDVIENATGDTIGFQVGEDTSEANFALEMWTKVTGGSACAGTGTSLWHYWAWPRIKAGRLGDLTFEYGALTFQIVATTLPTTADWGAGPYTPPPMPASVVVAADKHLVYVQTDVAPPAVTDGCVAMTDPSPLAAGVTLNEPEPAPAS